MKITEIRHSSILLTMNTQPKGGLTMFTDVFHTVPETTLDISELSSLVDATTNSNTAETNDTDATSTPEHTQAATVTAMSAYALVLALDRGDIPLASLLLAEYHASEAVRAVWGSEHANVAMQVYLIKKYQNKDMALAQRAGVVFTSNGLYLAIDETRPKDFEPWCPRTKAYVSKRIDLAMNVVQQLLDMGVHRCEPTTSWLCYVLEFPTEHLRLVDMLLAAGCDPAGLGEDGLTPLMTVAQNKQTTPKQRAALTARLVRAGADVDAQSQNGHTALHFAVAAKNVDMFKVLANYKAQMNSCATGATSPLMLAVSHGHLCCIKKLVAAGADVNFRCRHPEYEEVWADALTMAIGYDAFDMVDVLLQCGAEFHPMFLEGHHSVVTSEGKTRPISKEMVALIRTRVLAAEEVQRANEMAKALVVQDEVAAARAALRGKSRGRRSRSTKASSAVESPAVNFEAAVQAGAKSTTVAPKAPAVNFEVAVEAGAKSTTVAPEAPAVEPPAVNFEVAVEAGAKSTTVAPEAPAVNFKAAVQADAKTNAADTTTTTPPTPNPRRWETAHHQHATPCIQPAETESPEARECVVCMEEHRTTAMVPCGHRCVCDACAASCFAAGQSRLCPMCRAPVVSTMRVYL